MAAFCAFPVFAQSDFRTEFLEVTDQCTEIDPGVVKVIVAVVEPNPNASKEAKQLPLRFFGLLDLPPDSKYIVAKIRAPILYQLVDAGTVTSIKDTFRIYLANTSGSVKYRQDFNGVAAIDIDPEDQPLFLAITIGGEIDDLVNWESGTVVSGFPAGSCTLVGLSVLEKPD
ncbi:MAG: hypothetical protein AAGK66_01040 [Pseudomonadota bacterium]